MGFDRILDKIIESEGCVIPDEFLRTGRRARSSSGAVLKKNASKRQRIDTNIDILLHPDSIDASKMISSTSAEIIKLIDESDDDDDKLSEVSESDSDSWMRNSRLKHDEKHDEKWWNDEKMKLFQLYFNNNI